MPTATAAPGGAATCRRRARPQVAENTLQTAARCRRPKGLVDRNSLQAPPDPAVEVAISSLLMSAVEGVVGSAHHHDRDVSSRAHLES